jgi:hypothetical protein
MNEEHVRVLVNSLLDVLESSYRNEGTLKLILGDCCKEWRLHRTKYADDPGAFEQARISAAPYRLLSEAVLRGEASLALLEAIRAQSFSKPN